MTFALTLFHLHIDKNTPSTLFPFAGCDTVECHYSEAKSIHSFRYDGATFIPLTKLSQELGKDFFLVPVGVGG